METEIYNNLNEIFRDVFSDDTISVTRETTAQDIEGWDSFKQIVILLAIEKRFGFKFNSKDVDGIQNVGSLVEIIANCQNAA
jgi:acyl carrier protein